MGFITILSREAGTITYGNRMVEQDRINLSVQVDLGNCSQEAYIPTTDVTALTDGVIWFENNFYIPTGVTTFTFTDGTTNMVATFNVSWVFEEVVIPADTIYVDTGAVGTGDGTSWNNAFTTLNEAVLSLPDNDNVEKADWGNDITILCRQSTGLVENAETIININTGIHTLVISPENPLERYEIARNVQWNKVLEISNHNAKVNISGLKLSNIHASANNHVLRIANAHPDSVFHNIEAIDSNYGIHHQYGTLYNSIVKGCMVRGVDLRMNSKTYNLTIVNCEVGLRIVDNGSQVYGNIYSGGNTIDFESFGTTNNHSVIDGDIAISQSEPVMSNMLNNIDFSTSSGAYFIDITEGSENLDIQTGSSLINAGANKSILFNNDILGRARHSTNPWSIGAYEFQNV